MENAVGFALSRTTFVSDAMPNEEANRLYEVTEKQLNKIRREFLENGLCNYKEPNGDACIEFNK